jgi:K+-transporting ATPase KdpF subunit
VLRAPRAAGAGGGPPVIDDVAGVVLALALVVYLVIALVFPERF